MSASKDIKFIRMAIHLGRAGMEQHLGGPFGAVIVKDGQVIGKGKNKVTSSFDPTAHAEIVAIRRTCERLGDFQLSGCTIYTSCEPCPMCLGAIYWARPERMVYACTREDAAKIGFDDEFIYKELDLAPGERSIPARQIERETGLEVFREWEQMEDKREY